MRWGMCHSTFAPRVCASRTSRTVPLTPVHVVVPVDQDRLTRLDRALDTRRRALHLREPRRVVEEVERRCEQVLDGLGILVSAVDDEAREDLGQALGLHEAPDHLRVRLRHPPAAAAVVADGRIAALPGSVADVESPDPVGEVVMARGYQAGTDTRAAGPVFRCVKEAAAAFPSPMAGGPLILERRTTRAPRPCPRPPSDPPTLPRPAVGGRARPEPRRGPWDRAARADPRGRPRRAGAGGARCPAQADR